MGRGIVISDGNKIKYRHEYKCKINVLDMIELRQKLKIIMNYDPHAGAEGIYTVKSLYFDNYFNKALEEKYMGISRREKFRLRYYGDDISFIKLEKKSKVNGMCNKQSALMSAEECALILDNGFKSVFNTDDELKKEFYSKMQFQLLRPKNIVAYEREAFIYAPGNVRVTFDTNIRGSNDVRRFLEPDNKFVCPDNQVIMEVKWDEYVPKVIKDIVQLRKYGISSYSKYAATRFI